MWPDAGETQNLLHRVAEADASATDELWERYRPALRRMIGLRLDQAVVAPRRCQRRRARGALSRPASGWRSISAILRCRFISGCVRSRGTMSSMHTGGIACRPGAAWIASGGCTRREPVGLSTIAPRSIWPAQLRDSGLTPAALAIRHELQCRFQSVLLRLDDGDREIILLRHFEQLSNGEAAQALGLSEAAAGMRHLRALRRLRALLGETPSQCG